MRRFLPGITFLSLILAGIFGLNAIGQGQNKAEELKLDKMTTDLLRKVVKSHLEGAFSKNKANDAHIKVINTVLGGVAALPGKMTYEFKGGKPSVTVDGSKLTGVTSSVQPAATAAVKDLVSSSLAVMAKDGFIDGGKKLTLAAADAKSVGDSVQMVWPAPPPPPPADPIKTLAGRLDQLAKDLAGLKAMEARLAGAEKTLKDLDALKKRVDDLAKQMKGMPAQPGKPDDSVKKLEESMKKLEDTVKKLEPLGGQLKALETRLDKVEKGLTGVNPRLQKIESELKAMADEMKKLTASSNSLVDRVKALENQLKKEKEEREKTIKKLEDELKKFTTPSTESVPGTLEGVILPGVPGACFPGYGYNYLVPAIGTGCYGEQFPVLGMYYYPCPMPYGSPVYPDMPGNVLPAPSVPPTKDVPKDGKTVPMKEETELQLPDFQLMSRDGAARKPEKVLRDLEVSSQVKRVAYKPIDLRGLTSKDAEGLFWKGYRLFWANRIDESIRLFEAATQLDDQDARFWYFRSLNESSLGWTAHAEASLNQAVDLHLRGMPRQELISKVLERVQGETRMQLREALDARRAAR